MSTRGIDRWRSNKSRRRRKRRQRRRILIVCEGRETERNYFDHMKREGWAKDSLAITVKRGRGGSREQIAQFAVDRKAEATAPYDEVWCVMDVEHQSDRASCDQALRKLQDNGIEPCLSNPAFEVWFLSHFQKTTKSYLDCAAVVRDLNPCWKSHFAREYDKADSSILRQLSALTTAAIENAQWGREEYHANRPIRDCNAATDVYRFVKRLLGPSK